jgi:glycosyltransferase involved in cell wall biosynthesis
MLRHIAIGKAKVSVTKQSMLPPQRIMLIIYEFVPIGDAAIIRWANIVRYLAEQGHHITVLTPHFLDCDHPLDEAQLEVVDHPDIDIQRVLVPTCGGSRLRTLREWVMGGYRRAVELNKAQPYDVVISFCMPIWAHIIASALRRNGHIPHWFADYGDPWSTSRTLGQGKIKKAIEMVIERETIRQADALLVTTEGAIEAFLPIYNSDIHVIAQGASFFHLRHDWTAEPRTLAPDEPLKLFYPGSFYLTREPYILFQGLAGVEGVHWTVAGRHRMDVEGAVAEYGVTEKVTLHPYANQPKVVQMQQDADVLLLTSWPVPEQISGKIYEYLATNKPIFYVTDHDDDLAARILREHHADQYICRHKPDDISAMLTRIRDDARAGRLPNREPSEGVGFDMRAAQLAEVMERHIL